MPDHHQQQHDRGRRHHEGDHCLAEVTENPSLLGEHAGPEEHQRELAELGGLQGGELEVQPVAVAALAGAERVKTTSNCRKTATSRARPPIRFQNDMGRRMAMTSATSPRIAKTSWP